MEPKRVLPGTKKGSPMGQPKNPVGIFFSMSVQYMIKAVQREDRDQSCVVLCHTVVMEKPSSDGD